MTNGEKLKEIFPDGVLTSINNSYYWGDDILVSKNWWNAEYKEPTTKNDLVVDKEQLKTMIRGLTKWYVKRDNTEVGEPNTAVGLLYDDVMFGIDRLHPVTPQEPQSFKWCDTCKEYDQEKHCCHRYSKVIRDTVAEIEQESVLEMKTVTNAEEAEAYPISENITKGFEEFTKMMFKQGLVESEDKE